MSNSFWQNASSIVIVIGVILTALGGWGQFYFGKKIENQKDIVATEKENEFTRKIDQLLKGNEDLKVSLKPFEDLAVAKFPNEDLSTALKHLTDDIKRIEYEHKKTHFESINSSKEIQDDGSYKYVFKLKPVGHNIVPILSIEANTTNKTKIREFNVQGHTLPGMSFDRTSNDKSAIRKEYRELYPGDIEVTIITEANPGTLNVSIDPFKQ